MPSYSPELIPTMRAVLEEAMSQIPLNQATPGIKAHVAEFILKAAADGESSYEGLIAKDDRRDRQSARSQAILLDQQQIKSGPNRAGASIRQHVSMN